MHHMIYFICSHYKASPNGHNSLSATVKKLTTLIGETGYFTNHSLRRTCATRLFQKRVDEQRNMAITGHRRGSYLRKDLSNSRGSDIYFAEL